MIEDADEAGKDILRITAPSHDNFVLRLVQNCTAP